MPCQRDMRQVGWFSPGIPVPPTKNWPPRYYWNVVESDVKHHNPNPSVSCYTLRILDYFNVPALVVFPFSGSSIEFFTYHNCVIICNLRFMKWSEILSAYYLFVVIICNLLFTAVCCQISQNLCFKKICQELLVLWPVVNRSKVSWNSAKSKNRCLYNAGIENVF